MGRQGWPPFPAPMGAAPGLGAAAAGPRASLTAPDVPGLSCGPWLSFRDLGQDQRQPATQYVPLGPQHLASLGRTLRISALVPGQHLARGAGSSESGPQAVPKGSFLSGGEASLGTGWWGIRPLNARAWLVKVFCGADYFGILKNSGKKKRKNEK